MSFLGRWGTRRRKKFRRPKLVGISPRPRTVTSTYSMGVSSGSIWGGGGIGSGTSLSLDMPDIIVTYDIGLKKKKDSVKSRVEMKDDASSSSASRAA